MTFESTIPAPELTASLFWFFRLVAITGTGFGLIGPKCLRPLRLPPVLLYGMGFSCPPAPKFWILTFCNCSSVILNPGDTPHMHL